MTGCGQLPLDPNCSDPAYAAAHPDLCANFAQLFLVPDKTIMESGDTVTYTVILRQGSQEFIVELGIIFSVADVGVAMINEDGVATGVSEGTTSVKAEWQGLEAFAEIDVVASCDDVHTDYVILIDNSKSMTQAAYTAASKLAYSKQVASAFCDTINYTKDRVAVARFNDAGTMVSSAFEITAPPPKVSIASIGSTTGKTDIAAGLETAIDFLNTNGVSGGVKAIVLFSDGEQNDGDDPLPIAKAFKDAGGFLIVVATRAWGDGFELLAKIASPGYFLCANEETEGEIAGILSGIKNLICGGCPDPSQLLAPTAFLNYVGFINWDVTAGRVDLVGLTKWNVRPVPEHGLYVDLQGSGGPDWGDPPTPFPGVDFGLGQITSKVDYDFDDGKTYRFSLATAGSLVGASPIAGTWTIRVRVGDGVDELITITDGAQAFEVDEFEWVQSGDFSGPITIEQTVQTGHHNVGTLIDDILLENITDAAVMLEDDFDTENPTTIPEEPSYFGICPIPDLESQHADLTPLPLMAE